MADNNGTLINKQMYYLHKNKYCNIVDVHLNELILISIRLSLEFAKPILTHLYVRLGLLLLLEINLSCLRYLSNFNKTNCEFAINP